MGEFEMARALWINIVGGKEELAADTARRSGTGALNPGRRPRLAQFDWAISSSNFAAIGIESGGRAGSRALKIDFLGRDTTRLDGEVKQIVLVRPGARYRLSFYAKTEGLITTEGPRIAAGRQEDRDSGRSIGARSTQGRPTGRSVNVDFVAPAGASALVITVKRMPRFSYDDPMRGSYLARRFRIERARGQQMSDSQMSDSRDERNAAAGKDHLSRIIRAGFFLTVVFTALAHGAVEPWSVFVYESITLLLLLVWATKIILDKRFEISVPKIALPIVALLAIGLAQSVAVYRQRGDGGRAFRKTWRPRGALSRCSPSCSSLS